MTDTDITAGSGEGRLKERRKRLWRFTLGGFFFAVGLGLFTGRFFTWIAESALSPLWVIPVLAVMVAVFVWFSIEYFHRVDELDWLDNLWAAHIGMYAYFIITFCWYFLAKGGLVVAPQTMPTFLMVCAVVAGAYALRKLGWR